MIDLSQSSCPLASADRRLIDSLKLLIAVKSAYFEPNLFRVNLNNAIQTLRNVTWILQKSKRKFDNFEAWYAQWQKIMRNDHQMKWLVGARNIIVKEGDLETKSLARGSVVESWYEPPKVELDVPPFANTEKIEKLILEDIPRSLQLDIGLLKIERRWVDSRMPDHEILESLAYTFNKLSEVLFDGHVQLLGESDRKDCQWFSMVEAAKGKLPPCMIGLDWDRTLWIDLRNESIVEPSSTPVNLSEEDIGKVVKKYPELANFKDKMVTPMNLQNEASVFFEAAKFLLKKDGYHNPIALLRYADGRGKLIQLQMDDKSEKHLLIRQLAIDIEKTGANSIILINEIWASPYSSEKSFLQPADDPNRKEGLQLIAADAEGQVIVHSVLFERDKNGKIQFLEEELQAKGSVYILQPIMDAWKRMKISEKERGLSKN